MHRFRFIPCMRKVSSGHLLSINTFSRKCPMSLLEDRQDPSQTARKTRFRMTRSNITKYETKYIPGNKNLSIPRSENVF